MEALSIDWKCDAITACSCVDCKFTKIKLEKQRQQLEQLKATDMEECQAFNALRARLDSRCKTLVGTIFNFTDFEGPSLCF